MHYQVENSCMAPISSFNASTFAVSSSIVAAIRASRSAAAFCCFGEPYEQQRRHPVLYNSFMQLHRSWQGVVCAHGQLRL